MSDIFNVLVARARRTLRGFTLNRSGNVAIIAALMMPVVVFTLGAAVDSIFAARRHEKLDGIADAAALAAVTPSMMQQSDAVAQAAAQSLFTSQSASVAGTSQINSTISISDATTGSSMVRTVTVSYTTASNNIFAKVLGMQTMPVSGVSVAKSSLSPQTNFYLMIDTSPSMGIAATTAGINTMVANTPNQQGCAFACHESDTNAATDEPLYNPVMTSCPGAPGTTYPSIGTYNGVGYGSEDNYALARCLGVTLRIDLVNAAVQNLMTLAPQTASENNTTYGTAIYTIDVNLNTIQTLTTNFTQAQASAGTLQQLTVYKNNNLTSTNANNDEDSYLDMGLQQMNTNMPNPGNGTTAQGDTPKEVLFIVSDAVPDYSYNGGRNYGPINTNSDWCTTIKNRGIRIAFLYLTYNPLPTNSWYTTYIAPIQPNIATAAENCASPGLYFEVNTDGDISGALTALFQKAVATAYLSK